MKRAESLLDRLTSIELEVEEIFTELSKGKHYFCEKEYIRAEWDDTLTCIQDESDVEFLEQVYYNDDRGCENHGYVLGVEDGEVIIINSDSFDTDCVPFGRMNGVLYKIYILEGLERAEH